MRAKTIASLMDSFFGDAKTGVQSIDYRAVPGWRSGGTHFITVRLPEETRASMLGSRPFLAKTGVNFTLFRGGLAQKRVLGQALLCRVDEWPPEAFGGCDALFDSAHGIGTEAPGVPASIYVDNIRNVDVSWEAVRTVAAATLVAGMPVMRGAQGATTNCASNLVPGVSNRMAQDPKGVGRIVSNVPPGCPSGVECELCGRRGLGPVLVGQTCREMV